ncbi:MAG TPA: ABC transporter permease, partial [Actinomycetes bacterium]|nr:ABC transporter permease [Actinomycetes bacterium]
RREPRRASVLGLTVLAVGSAVTGLTALLGRAGAALGALLMVLVGNPLSGITSAPELLPEPAGAIGQLLPPGAGGSLLRSSVFFDGAGATVPLTVLVVWAVLGLTAAWVAAGLHRRSSSAVAPSADPIAVP